MQPSCIGDGHPWESLLSTVRAWLRVSTQACNQGQIQVELVHQPILERSLFSKRFVHIVELQIKWKNLSQSKILGGVLQVKHLCVYIYTYIYCICLITLFNSSDPIHRDSLKGSTVTNVQILFNKSPHLQHCSRTALWPTPASLHLPSRYQPQKCPKLPRDVYGIWGYPKVFQLPIAMEIWLKCNDLTFDLYYDLLGFNPSPGQSG